MTTSRIDPTSPRFRKDRGFYLVHYKTQVLIVNRFKQPDPLEYPSAGFAEGPFPTEEDARTRLRWMNLESKPVFVQDHRYRSA